MNDLNDLLPQVRAEVANFIHTITDAAESGNSEFMARCMELFSEFFAQAVIDGQRHGRMQAIVHSDN